MSCGPLNGLLTSSLSAASSFLPILGEETQSIYSIALDADYQNNVNQKFNNIDLACGSNISNQLGFLTSSLACENLVMPFGTDITNQTHGYSLQAELSSSLEGCIYPWFNWFLS